MNADAEREDSLKRVNRKKKYYFYFFLFSATLEFVALAFFRRAFECRPRVQVRNDFTNGKYRTMALVLGGHYLVWRF